MRRLALIAGVAGATAAGVGLAERAAARRLRLPGDPHRDHLHLLPDDVGHRRLESHDGGSIHLVERGGGRPLVLVHGITLHAGVWAPQLHTLADRYRVVALDVRGHGQSTPGNGGFGRAQAARDLATVLEELDLSGSVLVGHSMGGMILMQLCAEHPEVVAGRVGGLVFMDTAAALLPPKLVSLAAGLGKGAARLGGDRPTVKLDGRGSRDRLWLMSRLTFGSSPPTVAVDQVRDMLGGVPLSTLVPTALDLVQHDARRALARTATPSLVLVGSRDLLTPPRAARRTAATLPRATLHVVEGAGHELMAERPEEVARLLDEFTAGLPPVTAASSS
ncbi:MAG TPA: alpha/beta hydrolase [Acidimicrobiales bacterium]|nr:alpha/beta hydrolase [Acidimicrobiales bacterium]